MSTPLPLSAPDPHANAADALLTRLLPSGSTKHTVSEADLRAALAASIRKNAIDDARLTALARKIVERVDANGDGVLDVAELAALLEKHPKLMALLSAPLPAGSKRGVAARGANGPSSHALVSATAAAGAAVAAAVVDISSRIAALPASTFTTLSAAPRAHAHAYRALGCGAPTRKALFWLFIFWAGFAVTVVQAAVRFSLLGATPAQVCARVGGQLSYYCILVLVATMLRRTLAVVARFPSVARLLPLDALSAVHIAAGWAMLALVPLHVGGHATNFALSGYSSAGIFSAPGELAAYDSLVTYPGAGAVASGIYLTVVIAAMAAGFVLRSRAGCFVLFHYTHAIGVPAVIALFVLHTPDGRGGWVLLGPAALLALEMAVRAASALAPPVKVVALVPLPGGACELRVARPAWWFFQPGQFAWLRVPAIEARRGARATKYHPFAMSSPAEASGMLTFHVKAASKGTGWTAALNELACERDAAVKAGKPLDELVAWVDGPYPAPCQGVLFAEHAVLVAAGVGVTPMASILGSMIARARAARAAASAIGDASAGSAKTALAPLRRLDVVWVAGETSAFSWFIPLLQVREHGVGLGRSARARTFTPPRPPPPSPPSSTRSAMRPRRRTTPSCASCSRCTCISPACRPRVTRAPSCSTLRLTLSWPTARRTASSDWRGRTRRPVGPSGPPSSRAPGNAFLRAKRRARRRARTLRRRSSSAGRRS